jgi:hypothetical protein
LKRVGDNITTSKQKNKRIPFDVKDCALAALATGKSAQNLKELRDNIETVLPGSIYYHFWGGQLKPRFDDPEYHNDFASWTRHALHDGILAEQLGMIDPTHLPDLEELRRELIDTIEERLDASENIPWGPPDQKFHFITSQIVVFDTDHTIEEPSELVEIVPAMTSSSIFYHFIDARRRTFGNIDDFSAWLYGFEDEYHELCQRLGSLDPFFCSLTELRNQLSNLFMSYFEEKG